MSRSFVCNGNVAPARFVKADTSKASGYVVQATAGDRIIGISQPGVRQPPIVGLDDGFAGVQDSKEILVYEPLDVCMLEVGGAVTFGDYLKSDSSARGVTASSDGDEYGARALDTATASGQLIRVEVVVGMRGA